MTRELEEVLNAADDLARAVDVDRPVCLQDARRIERALRTYRIARDRFYLSRIV